MGINRQRELEELRERIVRDLYLDQWRDVWFFPPHNGVEGWRGTGPVFFVGLNPSTTEFPNEADRRFYAALAAHGLNDAHLTDILKERASTGRLQHLLQDPGTMERHRRYFLEELRILQPRLIVGVGQQAQQRLEQWLPNGRQPWPMPHYSPRIRSAANWQAVTDAIAAIRAERDRLVAGPPA
jgi:hypothetical protein